MDGNEMGRSKSTSPDFHSSGTNRQDTRARDTTPSLEGLAQVAALEAGVERRSGAGIGPREERKDEKLEEFKKAIMNEMVLDFSWYCRGEPRSQQDMENWWLRRKGLVEAVREGAWPAWGTAGATRRCEQFLGGRGGRQRRNPQRNVAGAGPHRPPRANAVP